VGDEALDALVRNASLSDLFLALARDLDVLEPKTPEDIYKSHLADGAGPAGARGARLPGREGRFT
jgi:26S proteasome regulatory subunit N1